MSVASPAKLAEEDPTFRAHTDEETGQTIIAGMGELHLDIIVDRTAARIQGRSQRWCSLRLLTENRSPKAVDADRQICPSVRWSWSVRSLSQSHLNQPTWNQAKSHIFFENQTVVGGAIPKEYIGPKVGAGYSRKLCSLVLLAGYPG